MVTLASVLRTSEGVVPVRMTVKFYDNTNPRLHVVINQAISESGSTFIHDEWTQSAHISTENAPATMTITDYFKLVNGNEEFTKRIPDSITGKNNASLLVENTGDGYLCCSGRNGYFQTQRGVHLRLPRQICLPQSRHRLTPRRGGLDSASHLCKVVIKRLKQPPA